LGLCLNRKATIMVQHYPENSHPSQESVAHASNTVLHYSEKEIKTPNTTIKSSLHYKNCPGPDAPSAPLDAPDTAPYTAILAAIADDDTFCEDLLEWVRANANCRVNPMVLEDAGVITRLCALPDHRFTPTLIDLAKPDALSLDILFDERLLPRMARMRRGHLRGTFLPYARQLVGFAEHDFMRELRQAHQALKSGEAATGQPVVVSMDTVQRSPVVWLWWPYIALGKLSMLDGDPGIGKSLLMTQLAASLSKGHPLPDQEGVPTFATGTAHVTVMLSTEDGLADTLKPRLEDAGADCSKIKVLTGWADADGEEHPFSFQNMPMLDRTLQEHDARLVIIDPIQAYLGSGVDMHRANETRPLLEALRRLAEQHNCAIVCIRHPAKSSQGGKAMHRGLGSVDFIGAARTGLFVEQHPTDPTKALLAQTKSNIGPLGRTLMFTKDGGTFEWCGRSRLSAEMLAGSGRGPDPYACLEAVCWLETRLEDGLPVASTVLRDEAEEEGIHFPTLRRAKKALGVRSVKTGEQWDWQLLALRTIPQPTPLVSLASLEHLQGDQAVSLTPYQEEGLPVTPEGIALPVGCGCPSAHPPEECQPQPVENMEGVQEDHEDKEAEDLSTTPVVSTQTPPMFCPRCHRRVTWLKRADYVACHHCKAPWRGR
jgi:AAA domain